jgi:hypothetical protein
MRFELGVTQTLAFILDPKGARPLQRRHNANSYMGVPS